ncbi:MAG: cupin domain-containing protein [Candidatus Thorarchaeota archaeon]|jgi:quercetin dioxygenase-like cupin family protein
MVKIFRASEKEMIGLGGYGRKYVADAVFQEPFDTAGFIYVKIPPGMITDPHAHALMEEVFIIMNDTKMGIGKSVFSFEEGDVVIVEPDEAHWFIAPDTHDVVVIAIKMPNLKDDKVVIEQD